MCWRQGFLFCHLGEQLWRIKNIDSNSFNWLEEEPSKKFDIQINSWVLKWFRKKVMNDKWRSYISPHNSRPGKIYGNIKTHETHNPTEVITAVKHLSIFVKKVLYGIASELASRVQDTNHVLDIIYDLDNSNLYPESVLMSFDIIICSLVSITKWG